MKMLSGSRFDGGSMRLVTKELLRNEGTPKEFSFFEKITGCDTGPEGFVFDKPVEFTGSIVNIRGILKLEGHVKTEYNGKCSRCLRNLDCHIESEVDERLADAFMNDDPDAFTYNKDYVDFDNIVRSNILLNLPMRQLCSEDCKGLCPLCGADLNTEECCCKKTGTPEGFKNLGDYFKK